MQLVFLAADGTPLVKQFSLDPASGVLTKTAYPNAYAFSSAEENCPDLASMAQALQAHAAHGHCLLKGVIARPLVIESRAGSTSAETPTDWICLDLDGAPFPTPDAFMAAVGLSGVSYVLQWSASAGIDPSKTGLHCHIFVRLAANTAPSRLKLWLQHLNLTVPALRGSMELTKTQNSCHWPLDVTTCQNDKLLFIAPPQLTNLADPYPHNRISYQKRTVEVFLLPVNVPSATVLRQMIDVRVNELRTALGIPKRKPSAYKLAGSVEYLAKPDTAIVTSEKTERGFTYLNLNDGDSWGYYHPEGNPEFIFNFKGEPVYRTEELLPDYYRQFQQAAKAADPRIYLAFRDFHTAQYYNGYYDEDIDDLQLVKAAGRQQLYDYMKGHGQELGDAVPDWRLKFDPYDDVRVNMRDRIVNTFQPSDLMRTPLRYVAAPPPLCNRIISHVLGDNPLAIAHFHNWMAFILQCRRQTYTGWVLHGVQGTGKGIMANKILMPIFSGLMTMKRMEQLEENFTGDMENRFLVFVDEIQISSARKSGLLSAKLKNMMVEPNVSSRAMYSESRVIKNYANFIFASNMPDPVDVPQDDRRFNVGDYQTKKLPVPSQRDIQLLTDELPDLYCYWMSLQVDEERAHTTLNSKARQEMIDVNMQAADVVSKALLEGDMRFFVEQLPTDDPGVAINTIPTLSHRDTLTAAYRQIVREVVMHGESKISRDQIMTIFRYCVGENVPNSPHKFTTYLKHHKVQLAPVWIKTRTVRGLVVDWTADPVWLVQAQKELA
jgi:hypothetical protein